MIRKNSRLILVASLILATANLVFAQAPSASHTLPTFQNASSRSDFLKALLLSRTVNTLQNGSTYLHQACLRGDYDLVGGLLMIGADPRISNVHGQTALQLAPHHIKPLIIEGLAKIAFNENASKRLKRQNAFCLP